MNIRALSLARLQRSLPLGSAFALTISAILACDDHDEFRQDVVLCEEAVAWLDTCCTGPRARIRCNYLFEANSSSSASSHECGGGGGACGCNDREVHPDLSEEESACIIRSSCDGLRGVCGAIANGKSWECR